MALVQRKKGGDSSSTPNVVFGNFSPTKKSRNDISFKLILRIVVVLILFIVVLGFHNVNSNDIKLIGMQQNENDSDKASKVSIQWMRDQNNNNEISLGPHKIEIDTTCNGAMIYAYITRDALIDIPLVEYQPKHWIGSFYVPIDGDFQLNIEGRCKDEEIHFDIGDKQQHFKAVQTNENSKLKLDNHGQMKEIISHGAWISSKRVQLESIDQKQADDYVWFNPNLISGHKGPFKDVGIPESFLIKEGSVKEKEFYDFRSLSNYELVCFLGSQSAHDILQSFLSIRRKLFPHQRPFKFHYYDTHSLVNPDETWDDETKRRFRKCKHILVSIDEPKVPLSQTEYKQQLTTFIKHLTIAFNDETFPIWIFSTMEPSINTKNCYSPIGKLTTEHPCNAVLKDLFQESPFSSQVRFLDNTDLTNPQYISKDDPNALALRKDILSVVALRVFIVVGWQVTQWRSMNQIGHINGLTKGDKEYPNFELIPYDFSVSLQA